LRRRAGAPLKTAGNRSGGAKTVARLSRTTGVKPGDIVRVHDGLPYLAEVIGQDGARVRAAPITGPRGVRTVTSRAVVEHWRKTRSRQPSGGLAGPSRGEGVA
jgi:hypothetical protein